MSFDISDTRAPPTHPSYRYDQLTFVFYSFPVQIETAAASTVFPSYSFFCLFLIYRFVRATELLRHVSSAHQKLLLRGNKYVKIYKKKNVKCVLFFFFFCSFPLPFQRDRNISKLNIPSLFFPLPLAFPVYVNICVRQSFPDEI